MNTLTAVGLVGPVSAVVIAVTQVVEWDTHSVVAWYFTTLTVARARWSHSRTVYKHSIKATVKRKGSPYSITERRVPELIPVLGSQPAGNVSHKSGGRLPLLSARPAVTPTTLKRAATNFAVW